jgi:hypothetical protein
MRVGPSVWGPPSCEGLLCDCCVGVVNLTFSFKKLPLVLYLIKKNKTIKKLKILKTLKKKLKKLK